VVGIKTTHRDFLPGHCLASEKKVDTMADKLKSVAKDSFLANFTPLPESAAA
jgi:hypothetical protein